MSEGVESVKIEEVARSQIKLLKNYSEIKCIPEATSQPPGSRSICFVGKGGAEEFMRSFTDKMAPYLQKDVYWKRDFGLWHGQMNFKETNHSLVVIVKMKDDFEILINNPELKNYDMLVNLGIFDQK